MKNAVTLVAILALAFGLTSLGLAGNTAQQTVTFQVDEINELSTSGNPGNLVVNSATAGSEPNQDTDNSTNWSITTNDNTGANKITGVISADMPANVTLEINLTAPTGGSSAGDVSLSSTAADLVTSIETVAEGNLTITYTLSASVSAGVVTSSQRTVTLTLTDE